jgi:thioredoxin reductase
LTSSSPAGGTAGHIAAIQAARAGVTTSIIEAGTMLGGTMTAGSCDSALFPGQAPEL